jgi:hypothetical protein
VLHRVIYASEAVGATGVSILSIAQILGVSEATTAATASPPCVMFHRGHIMQADRGRARDIDRLMRRLLADPRHTGLRMLVDTPISSGAFPMAHQPVAGPAGHAPARRLGLLSLTANEAEALLAWSTPPEAVTFARRRLTGACELFRRRIERYARHLVLSEVGGPGQQRLKAAPGSPSSAWAASAVRRPCIWPRRGSGPCG